MLDSLVLTGSEVLDSEFVIDRVLSSNEAVVIKTKLPRKERFTPI